MNTISTKPSYYNSDFFGKWAWLYDFEKYLFSPFRIKAAKFLQAPKNSKVLDVATGTGAQAVELAKLGLDVIGIDIRRYVETS